MRKKLLTALGIFFLLSLFLLVFNDSKPVRFIQGMAQSVYRAPKAALYSFSASANEATEIERLRRENTILRERLTGQENLQKDNEALKSQFEEEAIASENLLPAKIVGFQGGITNPEMLVIDKGNRDGLSKGQAVILGKNLVGTISIVSDRYSSVLVVTNPSFSTVARTNSSGALGVVQGAGDFIMFDNVAVTDAMKKGEIVQTRGTVEGEKGGIPPDLVIGAIESVRKVESEPFQEAQIKSLLNISRLTKVFVMK